MKEDTKPLRDREWLYEQYVSKEQSTYEIADKLNIHATTVGNWLTKHEIELRDRTAHIDEESANNTYRNETWLRDQYVAQGKTQVEIANELNVTGPTIVRWMRRYDIETGTDSSNWPTEALTLEED